MKKLLKECHSIFALSKKELGKTPLAKHNIYMKPDVVPVRSGAYRCSPKEYEFMEREVDLLLQLKCIERCETTWALPVIMVKKKDTEELRMCIDFR